LTRGTTTADGNETSTRAGALELWHVDTRASGAALGALEEREHLLSDWERKRAAEFSDREQAGEWLAAHIALRVVLERVAGRAARGVAFTRFAGGKPRLEGASVAFSLSHVAGAALIAITRGGIVGVDLERARKVRVREPRQARVEAAAAALDPAEPLPPGGEARFLQAWVRLEAFAKAEGSGVGRLLTRLGVSGDAAGSEAEFHVRIDGVLGATQVAATRDVALGEALFAAVACGPKRAAFEVFRLPADKSALRALLA
jgi:4'-phosphopantetheinyl transferase